MAKDGTTKQLDLVLYGATGFTGKLALQHLLREYVVGDQKGQLRMGIAGRSRRRLEEALREAAEKVGIDVTAGQTSSLLLPQIVEADSNVPESLRQLCRSTRVVVSTVGPFRLYGEALVAACVEEGCHYCDITGEVDFVRSVVERFQDKAVATGAKIVHFCGFDCIPSDMATAFLQSEALRLYKRPCQEVRLRITQIRGGVSGGTIDSMLEALDSPNRDQMLSHYGLVCTTPVFKARPVKLPSSRITGVSKEDDVGHIFPFVMADVNATVVRWTNGLRDNVYGDAFRYSEALALRLGYWRTLWVAGMMKIVLCLLQWRLTRPFVRFFLPASGSGPSASTLANGRYEALVLGTVSPTAEDANRRQMIARVCFAGDPGYLWAGRFVAECGAMLALREGETTNAGRGGIFSPGAGIGMSLLPQLRRCGFAIELKNDGSSASKA